MLLKTSTTASPWTVVPANDKLYARVNVLETVVEALESSLDLSLEADEKSAAKKKKKKK
jgi:polyphosphate kinase 2 (PPK2 family)